MAIKRNKGSKKKKKQQLSLKLKGKKDFTTVNHRDWKRLPDGVIELIAQRLPVTDCVHFSNVCNSWKTVVAEAFPHKQTRGFPWLVMSGPKTNKTRTCFSIVERKVRCLEVSGNSSSGYYVWGSFQDWLIMVKPGIVQPLRHEICLFNPFSGTEVVLPKMNHYQLKLVISGSPSKESSVYMLVGRFTVDFSLWIPGFETWVEHKVDCRQTQFLDAISYNGNFYLLTTRYNIVVVDAAHASSAVKAYGSAAQIKTRFYKTEMPRMLSIDSVFTYLLDSSGEMLLIRRLFNGYRTYAFEVFKLDLCRMAWVRLHDLAGRIVFVGRNCSMSMSAEELGDENDDMDNCIFFANDYKFWFLNPWDVNLLHDDDSEIDDWGIFNLYFDRPGNFSYDAKRSKCQPFWISAPIWWYCLGN